jgi:cation:H+ antiporter
VVLVWIEFIICALIIAIAGRKVAKYGDIIAEKTGLGGVWVGVLLLAIVTSLPELFTGISAVALVEAPDLAIGDLFGSNAINLLIIALLDIAYHNGPLLTAASPGGHLRIAGLSMALVAIGAGSIFISIHISEMGIGWVGVYTPIIILLYLFMMWTIFNYERHQQSQVTGAALEYEHVSLRRTYLYFAASAIFVIGAGIWLAFIGKEIAEVTGLGESFIGSLFLAITTSLPEVAVSFSALRIGAVDMSVANMVGSNLLNMALIGIIDLFYWQGPILSAVSESHIFTGIIVLLMSGVLIAGILSRPRRKTPLRVSWYTPALIALCILAVCVSFITGN